MGMGNNVSDTCTGRPKYSKGPRRSSPHAPNVSAGFIMPPAGFIGKLKLNSLSQICDIGFVSDKKRLKISGLFSVAQRGAPQEKAPSLFWLAILSGAGKLAVARDATDATIATGLHWHVTSVLCSRRKTPGAEKATLKRPSTEQALQPTRFFGACCTSASVKRTSDASGDATFAVKGLSVPLQKRSSNFAVWKREADLNVKVHIFARIQNFIFGNSSVECDFYDARFIGRQLSFLNGVPGLYCWLPNKTMPAKLTINGDRIPECTEKFALFLSQRHNSLTKIFIYYRLSSHERCVRLKIKYNKKCLHAHML